MPQVRDNYANPVPGNGVNLGMLAADCAEAADAVVDFSLFYGANFQFNAKLDLNGACDCAWGGSALINLDGVSVIRRARPG